MTAESARPLPANLASQVSALSDSLIALLPETDNTACSPLSIYLCAAMAFEGASGDTRAGLAKALNCDLMTSLATQIATLTDALHRSTGATLNASDYPSQLSSDTRRQLLIANGMFYNGLARLEEPFVTTMKEQFRSTLHALDFVGDPEHSANVINGWVAESTRGKISGMVDSQQISAMTGMFLANAIYFKAPWHNEEARAHSSDFFTFDGSMTVDEFTQDTRSYRITNDYFAAELPYKRMPVSFVVLVPKDWREGRFAAARKLLLQTATELVQGPEDTWQAATLSLPKFSFDSDIQLRDAFIELGAGAMFDPKRNDFTAITRDMPLFVSSFKHRAWMEVTEKGTEAAAVTMIEMATGIPQQPPVTVHLRADRPFHFAIIDQQTAIPLFVGSVTRPDESKGHRQGGYGEWGEYDDEVPSEGLENLFTKLQPRQNRDK